jgi:hypothetical protein
MAMTEEEHVKLVSVGDYFYEKFGELIADCLKEMPEHLHAETLDFLSDKSSVFGSCYLSYLKAGQEEG